MTDEELRDAAIIALKQTTISYPQWQKNVAQGVYADVTKTKWWQAFDLLGKIGGGNWTLRPPRNPITTVTNPPTLGLNINNQVGTMYKDYVIDGGGDSSVLLQGDTHGCLLERFKIMRTNANPAVSQAAHGMYVKARDNTFSDIGADNTNGHGISGLSVRMGGNVFERTVLNAYIHAFTYYEHDGQARSTPVTARDGLWFFTGDTAIWGDDSNEPPSPYIKQAFLFENIEASGPAGAYFLKFGPSSAGGDSYRGDGVTIKNCTINGRPVTSANVAGVSNLRIL